MERVVEEVRLFMSDLRDKLPRGPATVPPLVRSEPTFDSVKILIADDDMRTVYALSALLRGKGAEVVVAETGRQALKVLDEHADVRVVLMDIAMPEMDGYEALYHLRGDPRFVTLPVIALTAKAVCGELERCRAAGASDYMIKPVDPGALLSRVQSWIAGGVS
jgi:CheY-like chemotaxis protein